MADHWGEVFRRLGLAVQQVAGPKLSELMAQRMAQMLWPGESAVGKRIFIGAESRVPFEVVGVVKTGKYSNLAEDPKPFFYYSSGQRRPATMALVMRANVDPRSLVGAIRGQIQALDVKAGDRILFGKWSGTEVKIDGEELLIMKESDIMGILG